MTYRFPGFARALLLLIPLAVASTARADVTVNFSTSAPGVPKGIPNWGLDTNWADANNMKRGLLYMGPENVNVVRVPGMVDQPLDSGTLTAAQITHLQLCKDLANSVGPNAKWDICAPGSDTVNAWFQSGAGTVYPDRWAQAMKLTQQFFNHPMWIVEPFNEPDYARWGEGTQQNLLDIMTALKGTTEFSGALFGGGSTMSCLNASAWYDAVSSVATVGTTHALYGSVTNYADFIQHVIATNGLPVNPELHNVVEAIIGAEYGLKCGIWWGSAELARGSFVRASQGVRLGYGEDRTNWTAAAVYRAPDGTVQAFLGSSERVGYTTTYTFHCTDRDVYFDGHGPQRDYTVTINQNQERVIAITWSPDAPPVIGGRYAVVNQNSGLALEVAGASAAQGAALQQNVFTGATNQLWNVNPLSSSTDGDLSYYLLGNVNSTYYADVPAWTWDEEAIIRQYNYPGNQVEHWYLQYVGNGYFAIRSRWTQKCLSVSGVSRSGGATVVQRTYTGTPDQLWRFQNPDTVPMAVPLQITAQPQPVTVASGQTMTFSASAVGTGRVAYQWQFNGTAIAGATNALLVVPTVQPASAGNYAVVVTDMNSSLTSTSAALTVKTTADVGRIFNLSIRSNAGMGDQTLIAGFGLGGAGGTKPVLIRGIGPTLAYFHISAPLAEPQIGLYDNSGLIKSVGAWGGVPAVRAAFDTTGAFPIDDAAKDAAFLPVLSNGPYTVQLTGNGGTTGIGLVEVYDASPRGSFDVATTPRLINASARTVVGTGDNVLIAGFAITGSTARTVLIRAIGPALAGFGLTTGTLAAPRLDLIKDGVTLATNIGWGGDAQIATVSHDVGAFPLLNPRSTDCVLLLTLPPGTYSAKVSGADGGTGIALAEIYDVP